MIFAFIGDRFPKNKNVGNFESPVRVSFQTILALEAKFTFVKTPKSMETKARARLADEGRKAVGAKKIEPRLSLVYTLGVNQAGLSFRHLQQRILS